MYFGCTHILRPCNFCLPFTSKKSDLSGRVVSRLNNKVNEPGSIPNPVAAEIATSKSALGDYLIGYCCCYPRLNTGETEASAVDPAGNKLFHSDKVGAFVRYPC